jgi:hypothetical protein
VAAIRSWNANSVRVLLNEDCWLGINGAPAAYSGATYRQAIVDYVNRVHANGMYAEVSLIWSAPGTTKATFQNNAPDADHSPAVWQGMAEAFKNDPKVILAPFGEPHNIGFACLRDGGNCGAGYNSAGMQQAVTVMRAAGYTGPIAIPGIDYANNLTQWLAYKPSDPLNNLIAEAHVYGKNVCSALTCLNSQLAPVAAAVPLLLGEVGETYDDSSCGSTNISTTMGWADGLGVGYQAWTWDTWGTCGSLISSYTGTPANAYGTWIRNHYLSLP